MRASRLLSILILLQLRGRLSAETLAREFEVSTRTIYRDIDQLSAAGVPVYAERGRAGGFALLDGYRTRLTGFTPGEADALLLTGIGRAAADLGLDADLTTARRKLLASLPAGTGASAQKVGDRFHLDPGGWYNRDQRLDMLPTLAAAVWAEVRIRIRYESWKDVVTREVDPLGLVLKGGAWYVVAAVRGQARTYRVSGIRALDVLEERFERPPNFDLVAFWTAWVRDFEDRILQDKAVVRLSPLGLRLLDEVSPAAGQAARAAAPPPDSDGWVNVEIPVEPAAYAVRQFLQIGAEIEVVEPPELREALAAESRRIAARYL